MQRSKPFLVHRDARIGAYLLGDFDREAVGVVQRKGGIAVEHPAVELLQRIGEIRLTLAKRDAETLLLGKDDALDEFAIVDDLGVDMAHQAHDGIDVIGQKRALDAELVACMTARRSRRRKTYPRPSLEGRMPSAIYEGNAAAMVGDNAQRKIAFGVLALYWTCRSGDADRNQIAHNIGFVVGLNALHDGGHALKTHAGIDIFVGKRRKRAVFLTVVLGEDAVPELEEAVAIASGSAVRAAAAEVGTLVEVDFGHGPHGPVRPNAPEIVIFAQTGDVVFRNAELLPDLDRLVVVLETVKYSLSLGSSSSSVANYGGPGAHFVFEILAEAEVARAFRRSSGGGRLYR